MSLRKNFDSFTSQHKLHDAQEEFTQAVYRFRAAEEASPKSDCSATGEGIFMPQARGMPPLVYWGESI